MAAFAFGDFWTTVGLITVGILAVFWFYMESQFKFRVKIKDVVNGRKLVKDHRARFYIDSDKTMWWKVAGERNKEKKLLPVPPEKAIELDHKGRKTAECYRFESGEVVWIEDTGQALELPNIDIPKELQDKIDKETDFSKKKEMADNYRKEQLMKWKKENNVITPLQPITSNQRMGYFGNIKKTEARKKKNIMDLIGQMAPIIMIVLVFAILVFGWSEIMKPVVDAQKEKTSQQAMQLEQTKILQEMKLGMQRIENKVGTSPGQPPKE